MNLTGFSSFRWLHPQGIGIHLMICERELRKSPNYYSLKRLVKDSCSVLLKDRRRINMPEYYSGSRNLKIMVLIL